ncbi:MerR family transcriptional regulator [Sporosarcina sp. Te-1]|uniref:MerR family transcriptional regulator n=1 Tax=Sporosarcina sp. Te-1 TaxID=2818390 RepID=UPI001A9E1D93|nr:MerR family transcriptional regulator [Sporosarcina sp. Te-1]QTD41482.1 MerR family transcriptional regulator [Sporosarcina sp. Te-1]
MNKFTIGELAKETNVNVATVRYYEKKGLIAKPARTDSGYRIFSKDSIRDIHMIKYAQSLGFTLEEIKTILLMYKSDDDLPTEDMYYHAVTKLHEIDKQLMTLKNLKSLLENVVAISDAKQPTPKEQCPLMQNLEESREQIGEKNRSFHSGYSLMRGTCSASKRDCLR